MAGVLLCGTTATITTKAQATEALPKQGENIPTNNRAGLLEIRERLFRPVIVNKDGVKASCEKIIKEKKIDLNVPLCSMTLLEEAILRRMEDAAVVLIELSIELGIDLKKTNPAAVTLGKKMVLLYCI
jgi:hypothetical protein